MRDQLAEISRTFPAIHPCAETDLRKFERCRLVRCTHDMNVGQHIRRTSRNFVKGNSTKSRQAGFSQPGRKGEDLRQLIIHAKAKIQLVVGDDSCRIFSFDDIKTHAVRDHTTTARQIPAFWNSGRIVTSHSTPALTVYLRAPSSELMISSSMILAIISAISALTWPPHSTTCT